MPGKARGRTLVGVLMGERDEDFEWVISPSHYLRPAPGHPLYFPALLFEGLLFYRSGRCL